ncbi:MAG: hypothetical protein ACI4DP_06300 [Candidatus Ornithomonoglobus sp.]
MSHVVDFFTGRYGASGNIIVSIIFLAMTILGVVIATHGRGAMIWLVSVCGMIVGILGGAMIGLLVFDSFLLMLLFAVAGGVLLLLLVKFVKSFGYFIGIGALGFFLAFTITSAMYTTNTRITENTILLIDMAAGIIMGLLAAIKSKYTVSVITAAAGGVIASVSMLALFRFYFADLKTWIIALIIAVIGMIVQIRVYDITPPEKRKKPKHGVKNTIPKPQNKHAKK